MSSGSLRAIAAQPPRTRRSWSLQGAVAGLLIGASLGYGQSLLTDPPEEPAQRAARQGVLALQGIRTSNLAMLRDAVGRAFPAGVDQQAVVTLWGDAGGGDLFAL